MGSFTATTPPAKGAGTATGGTGSAPATSHADQRQGAPTVPTPAPAAPVVPAYTHADQIQGAVPLEDGILSGGHREAINWPDPSASPWLNPPSAPLNALDPFGGRGAPQPGESRAATPQLPPPPPLPSKPAPVPGTPAGLAGRTATSGQTPVYAPNEAEGGGNSAASAAYVQRKTADASNDRQVSALGRIRGVGDLPTYTADAAENYGDQGVHEVADLIHRTAKADPEQGKALLEQTTARISAANVMSLCKALRGFCRWTGVRTLNP
jgi:hypothetical protein